MSDSDAGTTKGAGRRAKVFGSPSRKYDIYVQLMRGETTVGAAAAQAGVGSLPRLCGCGRSPGRALWRRWPPHGQEPRASLLVTSSPARPGPRLTDSRAR